LSLGAKERDLELIRAENKKIQYKNMTSPKSEAWHGPCCNALFNYLIILLDVMIYVYILYDFDDYVTYL